MPKQYYKISNFSDGMNNLQDPRDIKDSELLFIKNFLLEQRGALKTAGVFQTPDYFDGQSTLTTYLTSATAVIDGAGGFGLFYFESDHGLTAVATISGNTISFTSSSGGGATP